MRSFLLIAVLCIPYFSFSQAPNGRLYFFTVPGNVVPTYLGFIEYPGETYVLMDSMLFDQYSDIAMIYDKLFTAKLEDVTSYDTTDYVPTETVHGVYARHISSWGGKLTAVSAVRPHFRVYDIPSDSLLFSIDTSKIPYQPADLAVWDDKAFLLMGSSVVIIDLLAQDTLATVATPHPYLNQDFNYALVDAGADFYIDVEYATGALRFSLLKMNKTTYHVETVFHNDGYANYALPIVAGDKIYLGTFDNHYSIADDSLYLSNNAFTPLPVAYDDESASLFLFHNPPNGVSYLAGGIFSDTVPITWYLSKALFVPAANDTLNGIAEKDDTQLMVFPNPTSGFIHIVLPETRNIEAIQLLDVTGKLLKNTRPVLSKNMFTGDISNLPRGYYFLKILTRGETFSGRFVKG